MLYNLRVLALKELVQYFFKIVRLNTKNNFKNIIHRYLQFMCTRRVSVLTVKPKIKIPQL